MQERKINKNIESFLEELSPLMEKYEIAMIPDVYLSQEGAVMARVRFLHNPDLYKKNTKVEDKKQEIIEP